MAEPLASDFPRVMSNTRADAIASLENWAARAPLVIVAYFAIQLCVRLVISSNLEVDDAEMVGQIGWALGYPNSHAPLYHWIVRICYDLFGYWPAATVVPKYTLLTIGFLLIYDVARRATTSAVGGAVAVVFLFFIPVVFGKTLGKLTDSILGVAATAGTLHATVLVLSRPRASAFGWLGLALAIGLLAKYNFVFVIIALAGAVLCVRDVRRIFCRRATLLALVIPLVLSLPHWLWVRSHLGLAMEHFYVLRVPGRPLGMHLSAISVWTGLGSLAVIVLLSAAPMSLLCGGAMSIFDRDTSIAHRPEPVLARQMRQLLGWILVTELAVFIVAVIAGKFYQVHERYLVVLLPPLPLWLALQSRVAERTRAAASILGAGVVLALVMIVVRPISILTSKSRLAFPYAEMAREITDVVQPPAELISDPPEHAVNIAIHVPGLVSVDTPTAAQLLVIGNDPAAVVSLTKTIEDNYQAAGQIRLIEAPWRWHPRQEAQLAVQLWKRRSQRGKTPVAPSVLTKAAVSTARGRLSS